MICIISCGSIERQIKIDSCVGQFFVNFFKRLRHRVLVDFRMFKSNIEIVGWSMSFQGFFDKIKKRLKDTNCIMDTKGVEK